MFVDARVLVAFYTVDRKIHVVRVQIDGLEIKHEPPNGTHQQPNILVEQLDDELVPVPIEEQPSAVPAISNSNALRLSYLEIIPSSDTDDSVKTPSMILASYSTPLDTLGLNGQLHNSQSVVFRWQLVEHEPLLHPSFDSTGSGGASSKPLKASPHF